MSTINNNSSIGFPRMIYGFGQKLTLAKIWLSVSYFIIRKYKSPIKFYRIIRKVKDLRNRYTINNTYPKLAYVDGRVFFNSNNNGWPSAYFNRVIDLEAREAVHDNIGNLENLRMVLVALTKKCPLQCEHCYEGSEINKPDTLTLDDHKKILKKLQDAGISLIQYGGGDPMAKVNDLVELLEGAQKTSDFWIFTSGYNFTKLNANRLKAAGLTGVNISLDHHIEEEHNRFRRNDKAYQWVLDAAKNAREANLVITLCVCPTRDYCTDENMLSYLKLAKKLGASFIQILEPRAVGNYFGQDVELKTEHFEVLDKFFLEINEKAEYRDMPIVLFPAYHQRKTGCPGAGSKYLYIDTDGYMNSCPFCRNKKTHILRDNSEEIIAELKAEGCGKFASLN